MTTIFSWMDFRGPSISGYGLLRWRRRRGGGAGDEGAGAGIRSRGADGTVGADGRALHQPRRCADRLELRPVASRVGAAERNARVPKCRAADRSRRSGVASIRAGRGISFFRSSVKGMVLFRQKVFSGRARAMGKWRCS